MAIYIDASFKLDPGADASCKIRIHGMHPNSLTPKLILLKKRPSTIDYRLKGVYVEKEIASVAGSPQ